MGNVTAVSTICTRIDSIFVQIVEEKKSQFDIERADFGELDEASNDLVINWLVYASLCGYELYRFFLETQLMVTIQKYRIEAPEDIMSLFVLKEGLYLLFHDQTGQDTFADIVAHLPVEAEDLV